MTGSRLALPLILAVVFFGAQLLLQTQPELIDPAARNALFGKNLSYLRFLKWTALIFVGVRLFDAFVFDVLASKRQKIVAPLLLRQIISIALYIFLFAIAISTVFQTEVTPWLASGTVVAAVLGLALQDTLGNLFSGISLHVEQAFDVGDVIRSGDLIGVVEGVNWRATRLRTFNNNIVVLPNSVVSRERLEVFPRSNLNARVISVGVSYDSPPARVVKILEQAASNVDGVAREIPCLSRVGGFGDSAVSYEIKYWTRSYQNRDQIDADIRRAVWYALRRNGIPIPYPIRTYRRLKESPAPAEVGLETVAERLAEVEILAPLSAEERRLIAAGTQVSHYARGETILAHGAGGESMFVVHDGNVSVRVPSENGGFAEVAQLGPGSIFGEMALLTGESRMADVVALTEVTAMKIPKSSMQPLLENNPDLASALSEKIAERRQAASALAEGAVEEEKRSILGRIRAYFALSR